jgi:C4-dicarboxylate transporter DctM subunit
VFSFVLGLTLDNMGSALSERVQQGLCTARHAPVHPDRRLDQQVRHRATIVRLRLFVSGLVTRRAGHGVLGACGLFAAISGSNSATTATIGSMLHPEMVKGGYDERFSAATAAAGGTVGIIIPPSIIFIVYGFC